MIFNCKSLCDSSSRNKTINSDNRLVLEWNNGSGLVFEREITIDEHYLIRVKQRRKYSHGKCLNNSIEFYYGILLNCIKGQIVNQRKILNDIYYKRCFMLYCLILFIYLQ